MPTSKSCFELVTDNIATTLAAVDGTTGWQNKLEVHRETKLGVAPAPVDPSTTRYVVVVPGEVIYHTSYGEPVNGHLSPMNADDYTQVFWIDCYGYESDTSSLPADAVAQSIACDVIKALNADYNRGTHPDDATRKLAIDTRVRFATPMELQQSQYRGVVLRVEVLTRTRLSDPFHLP
jgi:hypothetical protein